MMNRCQFDEHRALLTEALQDIDRILWLEAHEPNAEQALERAELMEQHLVSMQEAIASLRLALAQNQKRIPVVPCGICEDCQE